MKSNPSKTATDLPPDTVLSVRGVSKKFCRYLRRSMLYGTQDLARNLLGLSNNWDHELRKGEFRALDNISFDLYRGEGVGLIGSNGSGKTTLLRILNGIFPPDEGCVTFRGRMGALIALGAGFHPHLSGRENVFLNGAILGMDRARMEAVLPDIIRFAEIGEFIDAPVSTYSSGMYVRLGFAVAAFTEPDIMLVDEVLAVGDIAFRAKCTDKITELRAKGMSVVFVGHDMNAVQSLCSRVIWLERGAVRQAGSAAEVIEEYMREMDRAVVRRTLDDLRKAGQGTGRIDIVKTVLRDLSGRETDTIQPFEPLSVELHYEAAQRIPQPYFWVGIGTAHGSFAGANMLLDGHRPDFVEGCGRIVCHFGPLPLLPQAYRLHGGIRSADGMTMLIESRVIGAFRVEGGARTLGLEGEIAAALVRLATPVLVPYAWEFDGGQRATVDFKSLEVTGVVQGEQFGGSKC